MECHSDELENPDNTDVVATSPLVSLFKVILGLLVSLFKVIFLLFKVIFFLVASLPVRENNLATHINLRLTG